MTSLCILGIICQGMATNDKTRVIISCWFLMYFFQCLYLPQINNVFLKCNIQNAIWNNIYYLPQPKIDDVSITIQFTLTTITKYIYMWHDQGEWNPGMSHMLGISILSYRLRKVKNSCFTLFLNFRELFISPQPDIRLRWNLDQNVAF